MTIRSTPTPAVATTPAPPRGRVWALLVLAVLVAGFNLRPAVASVSPLLDEIRTGEGLSGSGAALLTTLPVVCFGLGALVAARAGRRFGMEAVLLGTMVALVAGIVVRLAPGPVALFGGTVLAGASIALANVLIPALIKRDAPARSAGAVLGASTVMISVGAAVAAATTVPVQTLLGSSWRPAMAVWALPAVLAVLLWLPVVRRAGRLGSTGGVAGVAVPGLWRRALAWQVTLLMGVQSMHFFALLAWAPTVFVDRGFTPEQGGLLLALSGFAAMPANFLAPVLAARRRTQHHLVLVMVALLGVGYTGILLAPGLAPLWMVLVGLGQGTGLSLSHSLITLRARTAAETSELSGMAQGAGYGLAALGPVGLGALHDVTGGWEVPLVALLVLLVPLALAGLGAARDRYVSVDGP